MTTTDPYTAAARLCDDDGIVRSGGMHHGTDYPCTGHAHYAGEHYRCTSPAHASIGAAAEVKATRPGHACCYHVEAARAVLADRERELLDLKGPCSTKGCRLHYAHSGPCALSAPASA